MSEVEKSSMDKKTVFPRPLAAPSKSSNENNGSINKFTGSSQKRDFGHGASFQNESAQGRKYYQGKEKAIIKENGGRKFNSNQRRDFDYSSADSASSRKNLQRRERYGDKNLLQDGASGSSSQRGCDGSYKRGGMNSVQNWNGGYKTWKDKHTSYPRHWAKTPYSKEQFLQANCQFVVRQNGNYTIHASNPDTLVDWDLVEQVRIFDHEVPSCPICLYQPKAAKITRCGHSYCWPCMLHYMSLFDGNYVNCPICYARVREKDLKSVVALQTTNFSIGQEITMKLMKKCRGQTLVSPRPAWNAEIKKPFCVTDKENNIYAKLLTADLDYTEKILAMEREELLLLYQEDGSDTLEGSFITAALKSLEERASQHLGPGDSLTKEQSGVDLLLKLTDEVAVAVVAPSSEPIKSSRRYVSAFSDEEEEIVHEKVVDEHEKVVDEPESGLESGDLSESINLESINLDDIITVSSDSCPLAEDAVEIESIGSESSSKCMEGSMVEMTMPEAKEPCYKNRRERSEAAYFYQSADGQHIYMQGLNISCLKAQYGDIANCPDEVTAKIIDLERIFMDEELRKKYRWLNHLPLTCEFIMAELELQPPLVSQEVLDVYADEILKRKHERERKQQYDNKRTQRIQNEESRKMGIDPHSRIVRSDFKRGVRPSNISSMETVFQSLAYMNQEAQVERRSPPQVASEFPNAEDAAAAAAGVAEGGPSRNSVSSEESAFHSVPSFAQMLKMGSPKLTSAGPVEKATKVAEKKVDSKWSDSDGEEARAPVYRNVFDFDIALKLAELDRAADAVDAAAEPGSGGRKKKKAKKLLFTSGHMLNHKR